jgi:ABC-type nitrate/sulfonate/bicarbonate transport system permease component
MATLLIQQMESRIMTVTPAPAPTQMLPHAMPTLFTGIKVAAALSATAAVVAEFVASDRGLGNMLL